jgi:glycosyltransferase involved in cell wall biosynthesis
VELVGVASQNRVIELLSHTDVFVLACRQAVNGDMDGIPTVLLEALSMEVPVVSTAVSAIPELIRHQETGYLARPEDPESVAQMIAYALDHPDLAAETARKGRDLVTKEFSSKTNAMLLFNMWQECLPGFKKVDLPYFA